ncbi:MAG TPA: hypothetical protein VFE58_07110 [Tepidisphaeraceae bacterium]|jgi:hypothetical protein|nr:hypothetical protein [Tepidisphaeraceae bacterium]
MIRSITSAALLLSLATVVSADITPLYLSPPNASPIIPSTISISPTGDIGFATSDAYVEKKHLGNVKFNDFTISRSASDVVSPPDIFPDGTLSFFSTSSTGTTITTISPDHTVNTQPLGSGAPLLDSNGSNDGVQPITVHNTMAGATNITAISIDPATLGQPTPITSVDGDFIGLSSSGHNIAYSYQSSVDGLPHLRVLSDDGTQSSDTPLPQFSSIGTPVFAGATILIPATTPGTGGEPPVFSLENPLSKTTEWVGSKVSSERTISVDTPASNDNGDLAFIFTDIDASGLQQKHIVHRDLAARDFLTDLSTGDPLNGSTITDLYLSPDSLADNDQLIFYAALADGSSGLFITSIPEPASLTLLALPLLLIRRNRSYKSPLFFAPLPL